jgi:alpha-ribazole phosphatase
MRVYLLRHGEIEQGSKARLIGQTDVPLNETGRSQARWWSCHLEHLAFRQIYCSDLARSRETAGILARHKKHTVTPLPQLREINLGQWDGLTRDEVNERFPGEWEKRGQNISEYRPVDGESFADLADRVIPAFETLADSREDMVLIVGHAGVNRVILCHVLGLPLRHLFRLRQDYGALNIFQVADGSCQVSLTNLRPQPNPILGE